MRRFELLVLMIPLILFGFSNALSRPKRQDFDEDDDPFDDREYGTVEAVEECYPQDIDCCYEFAEYCHSDEDCNDPELLHHHPDHHEDEETNTLQKFQDPSPNVCCFANCSLVCYPRKLVGIVPEDKNTDKKVEPAESSFEVLRSVNDNSRYLRDATKSRQIKANRPKCWVDNEDENHDDGLEEEDFCCYSFYESCHDDAACQTNFTCCEVACGSLCWPTELVGSQIGTRQIREDDSPSVIKADETSEITQQNNPFKITRRMFNHQEQEFQIPSPLEIPKPTNSMKKKRFQYNFKRQHQEF